MAEIVRKRDRDGRAGFQVEWEGNDGRLQKRLFKTRSAAEKYSLQVETGLLNEAVRSFNETFASLSPENARRFLERIQSST